MTGICGSGGSATFLDGWLRARFRQHSPGAAGDYASPSRRLTERATLRCMDVAQKGQNGQHPNDTGWKFADRGKTWKQGLALDFGMYRDKRNFVPALAGDHPFLT